MKATFSSRILLILCFLFVFVTAADSKNFESPATQTTSDYVSHCGQCIEIPTHHFQIPGKSQPAIPGAELPDDNEGEEKPGFDEDGKEFLNYLLAEHQLQRLTERSLLPFTRILENRPTVSLFILHHCWKSFLQ